MPTSAVLSRPLSCEETILVEHPGWRQSDDGFQRVFVSQDTGRTLIMITSDKVIQHRLTGDGAEPRIDTFTLRPFDLTGVPALRDALTTLGVLARYRTSSLWEAFAWAILRLRDSEDPELVYRAICEYGEHIHLPDGSDYPLFPTPRQILALENRDFHNAGLDKTGRRPLVAAAEAYLEHGTDWCRQPRGILYHSLQVVPRVGIATARSAVADWTNDWSLYPYSDADLRGYAAQAAPSFDWPDDQVFGPVWQELADGNLSSVTLFMLAWGMQQSARRR